MKKLSDLFTQSGLFEAIKAHHKHLHENYNFPPLKGMKSLHKFAESLGFKSTEQFRHALTSVTTTTKTTLSHSVAIEFGNKGNPQKINIYVEDEDNTLRLQQEDGHDFIIFSLEDKKDHEFLTRTTEMNTYCITRANLQIILKLHPEDGFISATIIECPLGQKIDYRKNLTLHVHNEPELEVVDYQTCDILEPILKETISTYILVKKQRDSIETTVHRTYNSAMAEFRDNIKYALDQEDAHSNTILAMGCLDIISRDYSECGTDQNLIADKLNNLVNEMKESELSFIYAYIYDDALAQINPATLN